ncbi:MAG: DinB family protein [Candidatus Rokubacteria bacterium]|nr:DinB family protein [Candidatus Rokubacteria bacterium]MBI2544592.1 DinB family protein [Candidatus Rokubacteria bacterium]MBI2555593.1 DinB family protein [Candidatus Rokubacteria bacterium]
MTVATESGSGTQQGRPPTAATSRCPALAGFRAKREETLKFLSGLTPEQWERGGLHPTQGRMTVKDFVALMAWHDDNHLDQLKRALDGKP